jgi:hypothetical protein
MSLDDYINAQQQQALANQADLTIDAYVNAEKGAIGWGWRKTAPYTVVARLIDCFSGKTLASNDNLHTSELDFGKPKMSGLQYELYGARDSDEVTLNKEIYKFLNEIFEEGWDVTEIGKRIRDEGRTSIVLTIKWYDSQGYGDSLLEPGTHKVSIINQRIHKLPDSPPYTGTTKRL